MEHKKKHTSHEKIYNLKFKHHLKGLLKRWESGKYLCWSSLFTADVGGTKSIARISERTEGNSVADLEVVTQALVDH